MDFPFLRQSPAFFSHPKMPIKKEAKKMKQQQGQTHLGKSDFQRFVNEDAKEWFESQMKARKFHLEKGFILQDAKHYGLPSNIAETIDANQWGKFVEHPSNPIVSLVREFYANILSNQQTFSMVRGLKISFSTASINLHFGLPDLDDEYSVMLETISVWKRLTVGGTK